MMTHKPQAPVVIEFVSGSRLESAHAEHPHVLVTFDCGHTIPLPSDQIVHNDTHQGAARIGLGGMSFEGMENENLVFWRVRDLFPEEHLHPQREMKLSLDPKRVKSIHIQGTKVWPKTASLAPARTKASAPQAC